MTTQELATRESALATADPLEAKRDLLIRTICPEATPDELELFIHACRRTGLDPFMRQIYAIKRQGKMVIQTGIDGYRLIADRTGKYAGNDDPMFVEGPRFPEKATVTVHKIVCGASRPFTASALWEEYYPGDGREGFMWRKIPHVMLGKVAESIALRKAFPAELSGVYTDAEMDQAGSVNDEPPPPRNNNGPTQPTVPRATPEQVKQAAALVAELEIPDDQIETLFANAHVEAWDQFPAAKIQQVIDRLLAKQRQQVAAEAAEANQGEPADEPQTAPPDAEPQDKPILPDEVVDYEAFMNMYAACAPADWSGEMAKDVLAKAAKPFKKTPEELSKFWRAQFLNNVRTNNIDVKSGRPIKV